MRNKIFISILITLIFVIPIFCESDSSKRDTGIEVRKMAVQGQFYPATATVLESLVHTFLNNAKLVIPPDGDIRAIIVPHAGYPYSGGVASWSYRQLEGRKYKRIILIGQSHHVDGSGVSVNEVDAYATPLGNIPVDVEFVKKLKESSPFIQTDPRAHISEHSLEVQLPFLKIVLKDFKIVPILLETYNPLVSQELAQKLHTLNNGENVLYVISTDLSHYPTYQNAKTIDKKTIDLIRDMDMNEMFKHIIKEEDRDRGKVSTVMCGKGAVFTAIYLAGMEGWSNPIVLNSANSGDVSSEKNRVVGYTAMAFVAPKNIKEESLTPKQKKKLLDLARKTIGYYFEHKDIYPYNPEDPAFKRPGSVFVTLKEQGKLRGCVGSLVAISPLYCSVQENALKSAFEDYRFKNLSKEELPLCEIEISVLTPLNKVNGPEDIILGKHGIRVEKNGKSAVYLPQVAPEQNWDIETTLTELSRKANLPSDAWKEGTTFYTFEAIVFSESETDLKPKSSDNKRYTY